MSTWCSNEGPKETPKRSSRPVKCFCMTCPPTFLIVVGEGGKLGVLLELAASHHAREIEANLFPGIPRYEEGNPVVIGYCKTVSDLNSYLGEYDNIMYLAYFGHSKERELCIGMAKAVDTNLSNVELSRWDKKRNTPLEKVTNFCHVNHAGQIRLFGCKAGRERDGTCIAAEIAAEVGVTVYAYEGKGGSFFTTDKSLMQGLRKVTHADVDRWRFPGLRPGKPLWLVSGEKNGIVGWKKFPSP